MKRLLPLGRGSTPRTEAGELAPGPEAYSDAADGSRARRKEASLRSQSSRPEQAPGSLEASRGKRAPDDTVCQNHKRGAGSSAPLP